MALMQIEASLRSDRERWTFVGDPNWREDEEGAIFPPVWQQADFDPDPTQIPGLYAHELAREDYALLAHRPLGDTDVSVQHKCPYGSVLHAGIVFRATDSARCYVLDIEDRGRKGQDYEITLWLQEASGYRRMLARGSASHSVVPQRIVQGGVKTREDWDNSSPDWVTVRVQASMDFIRVSMDGRIVFDTRDRTLPVGCAGLVARGSVMFRNLRVAGEPADLPAPWTAHEGELPRFFYPGGTQDVGFNAFPVVCRTPDGVVLVAWTHGAGLEANLLTENSIVLARSQDEGRTWCRQANVLEGKGFTWCSATSLFAHRDGSLSCLISRRTVGPESEQAIMVMRSSDGGEGWSEPEPFLAGGRALDRTQGPYSPMQRLSDGTVVFCGYEARTTTGRDEATNAERLDRSLFFRSNDDGVTWEKPVYFDEDNYDHNECMVAETEPGKLVAFMRTLAAPFMWTSRSEDSGRTWTPLVQSNVSGECPYLVRHSSGALVMASRGYGTFVKLSFDEGRSWTTEWRISPASAMLGMTELADGRIMIVMHEGYRVPGYIRGQFFRVTPDGPVAAEETLSEKQ